MIQHTALKLDFRKKSLLATTGFAVVAGPIAFGLINTPQSLAQTQNDNSAPPSFEVASIKPNNSGTRNSSTGNHGNRINAVNVTLQEYLRWAFGVTQYQVVGPDWAKSERYDIAAVAPGRPTDEQLRLMLQALLTDRFKLKVHREARVLPVYELVVVKNGPKLEQTEAAGDSSTNSSRGSIFARKSSMAHFAEVLTRQLDRPVLDKTALEGIYDLKLEWTPEDKRLRASDPANASTAMDDTGPSIFTAIQEQLGLRLEPRKAPVEVWIVDHIERVPTEN